MTHTKEFITVGEKNCYTYVSETAEYLLIQPVDDHDLEGLDAEVEAIAAAQGASFALIAFKIEDWNQELSPWEAPAVFGKMDFGAGAGQTLDFVLHQLIPEVRDRYAFSEELPVILGGYSLAGFFALWSAYQADVFSAVMAASPSVWFDGWTDYAKAHEPMTGHVYLSLGDKEEKARNPRMARVGDAIREQKALLAAQEMDCVLEWNAGNHFRDADGRCAKGFIWCMEVLRNE